jgi:hypothetical protein
MQAITTIGVDIAKSVFQVTALTQRSFRPTARSMDLLIMGALHFMAMYVLMYAMVYTAADVFSISIRLAFMGSPIRGSWTRSYRIGTTEYLTSRRVSSLSAFSAVSVVEVPTRMDWPVVSVVLPGSKAASPNPRLVTRALTTTGYPSTLTRVCFAPAFSTKVTCISPSFLAPFPGVTSTCQSKRLDPCSGT